MRTPTKPPAWRRYLRFWGSNIPKDVDDELRFHIEMRTREYVAGGMSATDARHAALSRLGRLDSARDECLAIGAEKERQLRQADVLESVRTDVRFAVRSLLRSPAWTAVALLTMALGIGASTAVFSVVDGLLVRPMSYPGSNRIFVVRRDVPIGKNIHVFGPINPAYVDAWRHSARSLDAIEGYGRRDMRFSIGAEPQVAHGVMVDSSFLTFAGVRPLIGRNFSREEISPNGPSAVLLAESFWRRQFGGARDVVGKAIRADDQLLTIVGVLPASLRLPDFDGEHPDVWLPLVDGRDRRLRGVVARLRAGVSLGAAAAELDSVITRAGVGDNDVPGSRTKLERPGETLGFRRALVMLSGAVALLLLVACANVAHLLLARASTRERELAVRYALGAGRSRLIRQLLTESLVLSVLGGALATVVGVGALRLIAAVHPVKLRALAQVSERSQGVWLVAAGLALSTGIVVGLLVGLRAARRGLGESLRVGSAGGFGRRSRRLRSSLVVSEIALSATLLVGALLLVHGVMNLEDTNLGFDSRRLYGVTISLRGTEFGSPAARNTAAQQLLERGRRVRGATGVTLATTVPPEAGFLFGNFETPERPAMSDDASTASTNFVSPDYFSVLGISLIGGRTFDATSAERNEAIINETMAKRLWPDGVGMPIGRRFRLAGDGPNRDVNASPWYVVIGISHRAVTHGLLDDIDEPTVYSPLAAGLENGRVSLILRASEGVDPTSALRQLASAMGPARSIPTITNVEQALNESIAEPRFSMMVLTTFAGLAVVLAAIGLYGVISYTVAQRTREIGIRMTLGATRGTIARLVVADGLRLSIVGVVLGLLGAAATTRLIQTALYGVQRGDPWSFAAGALVLIGVSAIACLVPTLRATAVDPVIAVRAE